MRSTVILFVILGFAVAILVVGGVLIWYQDEHPFHPAPVAPGGAETSAAPSKPIAVVKPGMVSVVPSNRPPAQAGQTEPAPDTPGKPAVPETPGTVDWDQKVAELMTSGVDDLQASLKIIELMSQLPETNKVQAAEFLTGLMPDEGYAAVVPLLTNIQTSGEVMDVLMVDLLDRPNTIQLPLLLNLARNPIHPKREEAKEYLELYLDEDHGNNWAAWEQAMKKFLQENPE
jgi:hypothetical protein